MMPMAQASSLITRIMCIYIVTFFIKWWWPMCPLTFTVDWLVAENSCTQKTVIGDWTTLGCLAVPTPTGAKVSLLGAVTGCAITCPTEGGAFDVVGDLISVCFLAMAWFLICCSGEC